MNDDNLSQTRRRLDNPVHRDTTRGFGGQAGQKPKVVVVVGPTASGKSDLAVAIAKRCNGEVISADSRQVYRGLDIGSGKITKDDMHGIPHHLLDVTDPQEVFTANEFKELGEQALQDILSRDKLPIIAGGTGFYIDVLLGRVVLPNVPPNEELRDELASLSNDDLFRKLETLDPAYAKVVDHHNPHRLIRAIEVATELGSVPQTPTEIPYDVLTIGIDTDREELKERIHNRLRKRMDEGMVEEVKRLHEDGVSWKRLELLGLEYQYIALFLQEKISQEEMLEELETKINQYARRQMTWFRRDNDIKWFKADDQKILETVEDFLEN